MSSSISHPSQLPVDPIRDKSMFLNITQRLYQSLFYLLSTPILHHYLGGESPFSSQSVPPLYCIRGSGARKAGAFWNVTINSLISRNCGAGSSIRLVHLT